MDQEEDLKSDKLSCDPYKNNNVPCYCVTEFSLIMSGVYLIAFMIAIVIFLCYNCNSKDPDQKMEM